MHKDTVTLILTEDLKMKATYAKMVTENHSGGGSKTKNLSEEVAITITWKTSYVMSWHY